MAPSSQTLRFIHCGNARCSKSYHSTFVASLVTDCSNVRSTIWRNFQLLSTGATDSNIGEHAEQSVQRPSLKAKWTRADALSSSASIQYLATHQLPVGDKSKSFARYDQWNTTVNHSLRCIYSDWLDNDCKAKNVAVYLFNFTREKSLSTGDQFVGVPYPKRVGPHVGVGSNKVL